MNNKVLIRSEEVFDEVVLLRVLQVDVVYLGAHVVALVF